MAVVIVKLGQSATEFEVTYPCIETLLHHIKGFNYHRIEDLQYRRLKK